MSWQHKHSLGFCNRVVEHLPQEHLKCDSNGSAIYT
jgi:hypothetical protein